MADVHFLRGLLDATFSFGGVCEHFSFIDGLIRADEAYALFLASMHGPGDGLVVEIGSYTGKSTCFLAQGSKMAGRGPIVAIDTFEGSPEHQRGQSYESPLIVESGTTFEKYCENLNRAKLWNDVETIRGRSTDIGKEWSRPIRLLFIDGDHSYNGVRLDFELFSRHVVPGGLVLFHDITPDWADVLRFYREIDRRAWRDVFLVESLGAIERLA